MLRQAFAVMLAALAAGCVTPPMPRELSDAVDGARVTLARNQDLYVTLDGNQSTGFRWSLSRPAGPVLTQMAEATYAPRGAEGRLAGSGGVTTFHFRGADVGQTSLVFAYRRPWEVNIPPVKTVRFDIKVE
jgi:inhibitor of cysteine peptidase